MKKETTYSLILALVNLCVWFMSKYVNLYYQILDKELDGMPYPPLLRRELDALDVTSYQNFIRFGPSLSLPVHQAYLLKVNLNFRGGLNFIEFFFDDFKIWVFLLRKYSEN